MKKLKKIICCAFLCLACFGVVPTIISADTDGSDSIAQPRVPASYTSTKTYYFNDQMQATVTMTFVWSISYNHYILSSCSNQYRSTAAYPPSATSFEDRIDNANSSVTFTFVRNYKGTIKADDRTFYW